MYNTGGPTIAQTLRLLQLRRAILVDTQDASGLASAGGVTPVGTLYQRGPLHAPYGVHQGLPQTAQMAGIQTCVSVETAVGGSSLTWNP